MVTFILVVLDAALLATPSDSTIAANVKQSLRLDPLVRSASIEVSVAGGIVTLKGTVGSMTNKQRAEVLTKKISGVSRVDNRLTVDSMPPRDAELATLVERRLKVHRTIQPRELKVQVVGGIVTLTGKVETWSAVRDATIAASEVRGVRLVRNQLEIRSGPDHADVDIRRDIFSALDEDEAFDGLEFEVRVRDGSVTLEGFVRNTFERELARRTVQLVPGVRGVVNRLEIPRD